MFKTATLGKRALAFTIDLLLLNIATYPLVYFISQDLAQLAIAAVIASLFYLFYFVLMEARFGQTLGKISAGIEVDFESKNRYAPAVLRNLTKAATAFFPFFLLLDMIPMFFEKDRKRFSELLSNTKVVMKWTRSW